MKPEREAPKRRERRPTEFGVATPLDSMLDALDAGMIIEDRHYHRGRSSFDQDPDSGDFFT